jgi:hypothetical protein
MTLSGMAWQESYTYLCSITPYYQRSGEGEVMYAECIEGERKECSMLETSFVGSGYSCFYCRHGNRHLSI